MNYKEYELMSIGCSDYAALCLVGPTIHGDLTAEILSFGGDSDYFAYVVDGEAVIGRHYKLLYTFRSWMNVYDDFTMVKNFKAAFINVYRAGEYGTIIQLFGERKP